MKRLLVFLFVVLWIGVSGCGSEGLKTSHITAAVDVPLMDSDVVSWVDATGAKTTACAATSLSATPAADSVNVTITQVNNPNTSVLPVKIDKITVIYSPANSTSPSLTPEYQVIGQSLSSGGSATIPVRVVTQEKKQSLQSALSCNSTIYNYYVTIAADIIESGTGAKTVVSTSMQLRLADFIDK